MGGYEYRQETEALVKEGKLDAATIVGRVLAEIADNERWHEYDGGLTTTLSVLYYNIVCWVALKIEHVAVLRSLIERVPLLRETFLRHHEFFTKILSGDRLIDFVEELTKDGTTHFRWVPDLALAGMDPSVLTILAEQALLKVLDSPDADKAAASFMDPAVASTKWDESHDHIVGSIGLWDVIGKDNVTSLLKPIAQKAPYWIIAYEDRLAHAPGLPINDVLPLLDRATIILRNIPTNSRHKSLSDIREDMVSERLNLVDPNGDLSKKALNIVGRVATSGRQPNWFVRMLEERILAVMTCENAVDCYHAVLFPDMDVSPFSDRWDFRKQGDRIKESSVRIALERKMVELGFSFAELTSGTDDRGREQLQASALRDGIVYVYCIPIQCRRSFSQGTRVILPPATDNTTFRRRGVKGYIVALPLAVQGVRCDPQPLAPPASRQPDAPLGKNGAPKPAPRPLARRMTGSDRPGESLMAKMERERAMEAVRENKALAWVRKELRDSGCRCLIRNALAHGRAVSVEVCATYTGCNIHACGVPVRFYEMMTSDIDGEVEADLGTTTRRFSLADGY